jgi:hypothetical protein
MYMYMVRRNAQCGTVGSTAPKKSNKRARLAVVRKGCIQAIRRSEKSTKPGPVTSPDSSSQQQKIVSQSKKKVKLMDKLTLAACTWRTSNQGGKGVRNIDYTCCGRMDCYREYRKAAGGTSEQLAATISSMRKYYHSLSSAHRTDRLQQVHTVFVGRTPRHQGPTSDSQGCV